MRKILVFAAVMVSATLALSQQLSEDVRKYVSVDAPTIAITHVRVVDGTGAPPKDDQTVIVAAGRIQKVGPASQVEVPQGATVLDKRGYTVMPGLVGMHNHLYYTASLPRDEQGNLPAPGFFLNQIPFTAPRLYLACGVTTMRTTGSVEPYTDQNVRRNIANGLMPGPNIYTTAPYLEAAPGGAQFPQMHELTGPDDARKMVDFYADQGFDDFKAYIHITRAQLGAAIQQAHKRGKKLTGHLCSVTFREAAELGIDDLEHGLLVATDFVPNKKPDECPPGRDVTASLNALDVNGPAAQALIRTLVDRKVAITSTLPVFEGSVANRPPLQQRVLDAMSPESRTSYLLARARAAAGSGRTDALLKKAMQFEYQFAKAGGVLLAGPDPTGNGAVLPGFGDQRELQLLVEAGFTPLEAIKIATLNGAQYLGIADRAGTITEGKQADLVLIKGDPATNIADIEKVETVFKDGVGYDSAKLIESVRGLVGIR